jgi:hypothetical protein
VNRSKEPAGVARDQRGLASAVAQPNNAVLRISLRITQINRQGAEAGDVLAQSCKMNATKFGHIVYFVASFARNC